MRRRYAGLAAIGAAAAYILARRRLLRWGATDQEFDEPLPGDDLIATADLMATRARSEARRLPRHAWPPAPEGVSMRLDVHRARPTQPGSARATRTGDGRR
jgi:hypothetical protein